MNLGHDPELPRGYQDADFEQREMEEAARRQEEEPRPGPVVEIRRGIDGGSQRENFQNATLQYHGDIDFSIAVHVRPPEALRTEEEVASFLAALFAHLPGFGGNVTVEIEIGPREGTE